MPALSVRIGAQGVREPLSVALKAEMRQLLTNLMCYNLSCVSEGLKMSTWRLTFDEQAIGAISYVFAQVNFFHSNIFYFNFSRMPSYCRNMGRLV